MKEEEEADRRRGWKTISRSGLQWTLSAHPGQLKTGQGGKGYSSVVPRRYLKVAG